MGINLWCSVIFFKNLWSYETTHSKQINFRIRDIKIYDVHI